MSIISAIEPGRRKGRFNVFVEGEFAVAVGERVLTDLMLRVGQTFTVERLKEVVEAEEFRKALESAMRLLELRARSSKEIEQRLREKGYEDAVVTGTLVKLGRLGLIDDGDFARQWVDSRSRANPKGARLLRSELAQKGVAKDQIDEAVAQVTPESEAEMAKRAIAPKIGRRALPSGKLERRAEYQRLAAFLQRRGFGWDAIKTALGEAFDQAAGAADDEITDERLGAGDDQDEPRLGSLDGAYGAEDNGGATQKARLSGRIGSAGNAEADERRLGAMDGDASVVRQTRRRTFGRSAGNNA